MGTARNGPEQGKQPLVETGARRSVEVRDLPVDFLRLPHQEVEFRRREQGELTPVEIRVSRSFAGTLREAEPEAKRLHTARPHWRGYYGWPDRINPGSRLSWDVSLAPGESTELSYSWRYYDWL